MMKCEFEEAVGKEVTMETFRVYEDMYNALPNNYTKQMFFDMINIKAVPESDEARVRREENEKRISEIKENIAKLKSENRDYRKEIEWFKQSAILYKSCGADNMYEWCRNKIKTINKYIGYNNTEISDLQILL